MKLVKEMDGGLASPNTMAFDWSRLRRTTINCSQHVRPQGQDLNSRHLDYETRLLPATLHRDIR